MGATYLKFTTESARTIDSKTQNLTIDTGAQTLTLTAGTTAVGTNLTVGGTTVSTGKITGSAGLEITGSSVLNNTLTVTELVTAKGGLAAEADIYPVSGKTVDLGTTALPFDDLHIRQVTASGASFERAPKRELRTLVQLETRGTMSTLTMSVPARIWGEEQSGICGGWNIKTTSSAKLTLDVDGGNIDILSGGLASVKKVSSSGGALTVEGVLTATEQSVHTAGISSGSHIVPDVDGTVNTPGAGDGNGYDLGTSVHSLAQALRGRDRLRGEMTPNSHIIPGIDGTFAGVPSNGLGFDLGSSAKRWRKIFTAQLESEGSIIPTVDSTADIGYEGTSVTYQMPFAGATCMWIRLVMRSRRSLSRRLLCRATRMRCF